VSTLNIDSFVNSLGYEINQNCNDSQRRFIDKALGVLVNDGVYAYYVFCKEKSEKKNKDGGKTKTTEDIFINNVIGKIEETKGLKEYFMVGQQEADNNNQKRDPEKFFQNLSKDLHKMLFFRDILERALIYARYHAKASSKGDAE